MQSATTVISHSTTPKPTNRIQATAAQTQTAPHLIMHTRPHHPLSQAQPAHEGSVHKGVDRKGVHTPTLTYSVHTSSLTAVTEKHKSAGGTNRDAASNCRRTCLPPFAVAELLKVSHSSSCSRSLQYHMTPFHARRIRSTIYSSIGVGKQYLEMQQEFACFPGKSAHKHRKSATISTTLATSCQSTCLVIEECTQYVPQPCCQSTKQAARVLTTLCCHAV